jgi:hypothetical protein
MDIKKYRKGFSSFTLHNTLDVYAETDVLHYEDKDSHTLLSIKDNGGTQWNIEVDSNGKTFSFKQPDEIRLIFSGGSERYTLAEVLEFGVAFLNNQMDEYIAKKEEEERENNGGFTNDELAEMEEQELRESGRDGRYD